MWRLWRTKYAKVEKTQERQKQMDNGHRHNNSRKTLVFMIKNEMTLNHKMSPDMGWDITEDQDTIMLRHLHTQIPLQRDIFTQGHHHTRKHGTPWHWDTFIHIGTPSHWKPHTGTHSDRDTLTLRNCRVGNSVATIIWLAKLMLIDWTGAANIILGQFLVIVVIFTLTQKNKVFFFSPTSDQWIINNTSIKSYNS